MDLPPDKLRGGYYTPSDLADWITTWCIRSARDHVLEPSCGDGAFLGAAARRLLALGEAPESVVKQIKGIEITAAEAVKARATLELIVKVDIKNAITTSDFFHWRQSPGRRSFDVVLGNPPFIRYQSFPEPTRSRAIDLMRDLGLHPNRLTNSWVPFVVASIAALNSGGRLGLVLPAELLQVSYAAQLRRFLVERFAAVHVIACNELFFDGAEQEVIVLLGDGAHQSQAAGAADRGVAVTATPTREALLGTSAEALVAKAPLKVVQHEDEKWLKYFLSQKQIDLLRSLRASGVATTLDKFASVDVGVVTGKNEFFVLNEGQVEEWQLGPFVLPLAARAAHLTGAIFDHRRWTQLLRDGERVYLLQLGNHSTADLPQGARDYVAKGEANAYHAGYKCSIREPWYSVPAVWAPDAFLFRQIHDFPRVVVNRARATSTDTIHRMTVHGRSADTVTAICFTSLTAASAEIEGRSYGGGVLELEPTEAERLLVPASAPPVLSISEIDCLLKEGRLSEVLDISDKAILGEHMGLSAHDQKLLRSAWDVLRQRRHVRRRARAVTR